MSAGRWAPPGKIPPSVRVFGNYPAVNSLLPGDLLLFAEVQPDWISRSIEHAQLAGGFSPDDARWTHAAVYLGDGLSVCEATFTSLLRGSVSHGKLYGYIGTHLIRARRDLTLTPDQRWRIALEALTYLGTPYPFLTIVKLSVQALKGGGLGGRRRLGILAGRSKFCSQLYAEAYSEVTKRVLGNLPADVYPASLSGIAALADVNLSWLSL